MNMMPNTQQFLVEGPIILGSSEALATAVMRAIRTAQAAGELTADRADPDGDECVIWVGPAAKPLAFALFYDVGRNRSWLDILYVEQSVRRRGLDGQMIWDLSSCFFMVST